MVVVGICPSILTMDCALGVVLSLAAAAVAGSPILAWQCLPQLLQTYGEGADTGVGAATRNFLLCLFSCSKEVRLSSAWRTPVAMLSV